MTMEDAEYFDRREAEFNRLIDYKPSTLADFAHQPQHDFFGDDEFERRFQEEHSRRAGNYLFQNPRFAASILKGVVRCPARGCHLGDAYLFPLKPSGERTLAITNLVRGESRCSWVNWAYSERWRLAPAYLPATCRHGSARLRLDWFESIVAIADGWKHALQSPEQAFADFPEELRRGKASKTFHPPAAWWRPK